MSINTNQDITSIVLDAQSIIGTNLNTIGVLNASGDVNITTATIPNLSHATMTTANIITTSTTIPNALCTNMTSGTLSSTNGLTEKYLTNEGYTSIIKNVTAIEDNIVTTICSINVPQNGTSNAGGYTFRIHGSIGHGVKTFIATATRYFEGYFSRAGKDDTTGHALSTFTQTLGSPCAINAARGIGAVTLTTSEVDAYNVDVQIQIDLTGSFVTVADITFKAEVLYGVYANRPILT